jgi:hypothetical protein
LAPVSAVGVGSAAARVNVKSSVANRTENTFVDWIIGVYLVIIELTERGGKFGFGFLTAGGVYGRKI